MLRRCLRFLLLIFLGFVLTFSYASLSWHSLAIASSPPLQEQQAKEWYQQGQINQAIALWQQIATDYQQQGKRIAQGRVLSYLALAYSQLPDWQKAETAINQSLDLLQLEKTTDETAAALGEALNIQGTLYLAKGNPLSALSSWEEATKVYRQIAEEVGILRTQINQSRALQTLGLYRRACDKLLTTLTDDSLTCKDLKIDDLKPLLPQSLTSLQQAGWLSLGQILRQKGNVETSQWLLEYILKQVDSSETKARILLNLGQNLEQQQAFEAAAENYQAAILTAKNQETRLKAQLAQFNLLIKQKQWQEVVDLKDTIETTLTILPLNKTKIDGQIYFAQLLFNWSQKTSLSDPKPAWQTIQNLLEKAQENAQTLNDAQGEIYALGDLGKLSEKLALIKICQTNPSGLIDCSSTSYFSDINQLTATPQQLLVKAQALTEQALLKSQGIQIANMSYLWQWQLGRILAISGRKQDAINAYLEAVKSLETVSVDLAQNRDFKFSFQEKVEPVYRELLSLLLPRNNQESVSQETLEKARQQIEALQIAELNNFFQDICVVSQPVDVAKVDPTAAIIYPLILRDRLVVLVSLPDQTLQVHVTQITQNELEETVKQFRYQIVIRSQRKFFEYGKILYQWLVTPFVDQLQQSEINTLVFVPDGVFRNVPMSALYDGKQYLIENYQVALTPSLTLLSPQPLQNKALKTLFSGLTETFQQEGLIPLFYVKQELEAVKSQVPNTVLINEEFTVNNLKSTLDNQDFPIVHLATHGQFSSQFEETFIVTWDSFINVLELEKILKENDPRGNNPIELLILSACETASGDSRAALGLAGFAVRAGARSTLATLWSVNDQATAVMMAQFYEQLSTQNVSKAEALRQAQLAMLNNRWYRHPYYWSAYTLVGNWL